MVLRFAFSNFRSFKSEQEISFIASPLHDQTDALIPVPGTKESALPVCAIYGGNASGKTTVLRAFQFLDTAVRESHRLWEPDAGVPLQSFKGSDDSGASSEFVLDFLFAGVRHQYGFKANAERIVEEWLKSYPNGRRQMLFTRKSETGISFGRSLPGDNKTIAGLTRANSLFLSAAAQNNHEVLRGIYSWFNDSLHFVFGARHELSSRTARMCATEEERRTILDLLTIADLGIVDIQHEVIEPDPDVQEKTVRLLKAMSDILGVQGQIPIPELSKSSIKLVHQIGDEKIPFELQEESRGTVAYLGLLASIVRALKQGAALFVDELDSSLHPLICMSVLRMFQTRTTNPSAAQLVFNTHDTNLLSSGVLRRDQIWFTEKDRLGQSHVYPLTDFKPRRDENLESGYMLGRYGAVPFVSSAPLQGFESNAKAQ